MKKVNQFDPCKREDRAKARLQKYTSNPNECPFYDTVLKSKCKIDPDSYRLYDCKGICFIKGDYCKYLVGIREEFIGKANQTLLLSLFGVLVLLGYIPAAIIAGMLTMIYGYYKHSLKIKRWLLKSI